MKLRLDHQRRILDKLDMAIRTLKEAREHAYKDGRFKEALWNTALVQTAVGLATTDLGGVATLVGHPGEGNRLIEDGYALFQEPAHFQPNRGAADEDAAQELYLYLTNTSELYGPGSMGAMIEKRYARLWKKGEFDPTLAEKGYGYVVTEAAKRYQKEHGTPGARWHDVFNASTRSLVQQQLTQDFVDEAELGNFRE